VYITLAAFLRVGPKVLVWRILMATNKDEKQKSDMMRDITQKSLAALREEEILKFWNENEIFDKSQSKIDESGNAKEEFTFL
jgi:isoleucyl-tRNA synthetase